MEQSFEFEQDTPVELCSRNVCGNGHKWAPKIAIAKCGGCGGAVLMTLRENCPSCNEPAIQLTVRTDYVSRGGGVAKVCVGEQVVGESADITMERWGWKKVEEQG